ncbi:hypothetical protein F0562_006419 [Nyssa sinensis]|uniref:RRM domain-containing protein n=1 Tax=Nyssa sinensis TaxID=561372 RepID=A0A5J5ANI7_9ASTE|nr:hypothetical protein F0562_006419 [Nyssa sinensis]
MGDYNDAFMRNNNAAVQASTKAKTRANVMQLKLIGQSHPTGLTTNLLKLFEPRPPLEYKPPPEKRKCPPYTGMAQFVSNFAEPGDPEYAPPVQKAETPVQRRARIHKLRLEEGAKRAAEELEKYDPNNDPNISGDPYKTLFVARLNYETTESRIKREFEAYGPIKRIRLITDRGTNKPRGYAFVEYMHTRDMKAAYKQADGKKLDNRRVLVDVERGRTVPNWRPRRLGGGLGTTRVGDEEANQMYSGRVQQQSGGPPRSEEPRIRDDRHGDRDREKSRERGKDRERERSREFSHERPRDRDHREDRHHRDRDRNRDRDRERDRSHDRARDHDRGRDRDRDRERDRKRDRPRERDRDYEVVDPEHNHGHSRDREYDYDRVESKHERGRHGEKERNYDNVEPEDDPGWYEQPEHGHRHPEAEHDHGHYEYYEHRQSDHDRYDHPDRDIDQYYQMEEEEEDYHYDRATSEPRERERTRDLDREYKRSERSLSRH